MRESGLGHQFRAWGKVAGRLVGGNETPASVSVVIGRLMTLELPYQQPHLTSMPLCWLGS